ncbi:MAG: archaellin/type IV pilin N-terminal domain-containing protein [archaeon]
MKKRGLSPVIATVLLITMVVVIGLIIFFWFKGMTEESITKFDGTNIQLICDDVYFSASYSSGELYISNSGDVPIYGMKIRVLEEKSHRTINLKGFDGLNQGGTFSGDIYSDVESAEEIILIPVLIGSSEKGDRTFVCNEKQHGYEIII